MMPEGLDSIRNARILVVEDSIANQTLARDLLVNAGCHVDVAGDGREALTAIETASDPYDAVLMDLQMPGMDGLQATGAIRGELGLEDLPIIAVTANDAGVQDRCLAAGANDCLNKPYHIFDLYAVLIRWIGQHRQKPVSPGEPGQAVQDDTPDASETRLPAEIPGIDMGDGLSRLGRNHALYLELLAEFADANLTVGEDVIAAAAGDLDRVRFIAHAIRSTAGNIGAAGLSRAAADTEAAIEKNSDGVTEILTRFRMELEQVVGSIRAAGLATPRDRVRQGFGSVAFDRDEAGRLIAVLGKLLDDQDLDARPEFDKLAAMLGGRGHDAALSDLANNIEALKFSDARRILARAREDFLG